MVFGATPEHILMMQRDVRAEKLDKVADVQYISSRSHIANLKRDFDVVLYLQNFTDTVARKELKNHGSVVKGITGAGTSLSLALQQVLLDLKLAIHKASSST